MNDDDPSNPVMDLADGLLLSPRDQSSQSLSLLRHKMLGGSFALIAILVTFAASADKGLYHLG